MDDLEAFVQRHKNTTFRHSGLLFSSIASGDFAIESAPRASLNPVGCPHLLDIYELRLQSLLHFERSSERRREMEADMTALCAGLAERSEEHVQLWGFAVPPHFLISVFETAESHQVLGCLLLVDRRPLSPEKRHELRHGGKLDSNEL